MEIIALVFAIWQATIQYNYYYYIITIKIVGQIGCQATGNCPVLLMSSPCLISKDTQNVQDSNIVFFCGLIFTDPSLYHVFIQVYWPTFYLIVQNMAYCICVRNSVFMTGFYEPDFLPENQWLFHSIANKFSYHTCWIHKPLWKWKQIIIGKLSRVGSTWLSEKPNKANIQIMLYDTSDKSICTGLSRDYGWDVCSAWQA